MLHERSHATVQQVIVRLSETRADCCCFSLTGIVQLHTGHKEQSSTQGFGGSCEIMKVTCMSSTVLVQKVGLSHEMLLDVGFGYALGPPPMFED